MDKNANMEVVNEAPGHDGDELLDWVGNPREGSKNHAMGWLNEEYVDEKADTPSLSGW
jgi:hypothetical protein